MAVYRPPAPRLSTPGFTKSYPPRRGCWYDLYVGRNMRFASPPGAALQPHSSDEVRGLGASRGTGTDRASWLTIWVVDQPGSSSRGPPVNGGGAASKCRVSWEARL